MILERGINVVSSVLLPALFPAAGTSHREARSGSTQACARR